MLDYIETAFTLLYLSPLLMIVAGGFMDSDPNWQDPVGMGGTRK